MGPGSTSWFYYKKEKIDRKSVKDLPHNDRSNEILLYICLDSSKEQPSIFDYFKMHGRKN